MTMIWLPKKELHIPLQRSVGVKGFFKLDAVRPDGRVRPLTGWFPNLITNAGLNRIGQGSYLIACQVGTNNTAPSVNDTGLAGYRAGSTSVIADSHGRNSVEPYYGWKRKTWRFNAGAASGNLAEVAVASAAAQAGSVNFSRALILDEEGNPATVTVLSDEYLDVTYEVRLYPDTTDYTGTITITGSGDHTYVARPSQVTGTIWSGLLGNAASFDPYGGSSSLSVWNGSLGGITTTPSGSNYRARMWTAAYGNNNLYRDGGGGFGLTQGNLSGYISAVEFQTSLGAYKYSLDPVVQKDGTNTLALTCRVSWTRKP